MLLTDEVDWCNGSKSFSTQASCNSDIVSESPTVPLIDITPPDFVFTVVAASPIPPPRSKKLKRQAAMATATKADDSVVTSSQTVASTTSRLQADRDDEEEEDGEMDAETGRSDSIRNEDVMVSNDSLFQSRDDIDDIVTCSDDGAGKQTKQDGVVGRSLHDSTQSLTTDLSSVDYHRSVSRGKIVK